MAVKQCCRNCHFLVKQHWAVPEAPQLYWTAAEREEGKLASGWYRARCAKGIWSARSPHESLESELSQHRKDCYFTEFQEGMASSTAEDLEERKRADRKWRRTHRLAKWALGVSIVAVLVSAGSCAAAVWDTAATEQTVAEEQFDDE